MPKTSPHRRVLAVLRQKHKELPAATLAAASRKRVGRVIMAMLVSNGLTVGLQFGMVPALIWAWGPSGYGEWLILYTVPGYLALADFGIIATANNRIDAQCARGQFGAANRTYFNSVMALGLVLFAVAAVGAALWIAFGAYFAGLFEALSPEEVLLICSLLFADTVVILVLNHNSALYRTLGRFNSTVNWQAVGRVVPLVALSMAAMAGAGIAAAVLVMLAMRVVSLVAMGLDLRRKIVWLRRDWLRGSRTEMTRLLRGAIGFVTLPLANMLYLHATTLIVAAVTSPEAVAGFVTLRTFTRMIPQLVSIAGRAHWSEISQSHARGEHDMLTRLRRRVLAQTLWLSAFAALVYIVIGPWVYAVWTGGKLAFDPALFWALLANALAIALYTSLEVFLLSINRVGVYALLFLVLTLAQILVGWSFVETVGVVIFPVLGALAGLAMSGCLLFLPARSRWSQTRGD